MIRQVIENQNCFIGNKYTIYFFEESVYLKEIKRYFSYSDVLDFLQEEVRAKKQSILKEKYAELKKAQKKNDFEKINELINYIERAS